MTDTVPEKEPGGNSLAASLVGQAAAVITLAAALIYGAGAMVVALRLYFTRLPWAAIVGQMPHDLIITSGFGQVVLPAVIAGVLGAILLNFLANGDHAPETPDESRQAAEPGRRTFAGFLQERLRGYLQAGPGLAHFAAWLGAALLLGAAEAGIALPNYLYHRSGYHHPSVVIPWPGFFIVVGLISAAAAGIALIILPAPRPLPSAAGPAGGRRKQKSESKLPTWQWEALVGACIAFAAIPCFAAISASTLFPYTLACSPAFTNGQLSGNLIATNGGWAYMVDYQQSDRSHDYFSVVPLSSVRLMTIGKYSNCNSLAPPSAPTPAHAPAAGPSAGP